MSEAEREKLLDLVQTLELKLNSIEQVRRAPSRGWKNFCAIFLLCCVFFHFGSSRRFLKGNFFFVFHPFATLSLISLMKKSDEEQWSLKQKLLSLDVERKSFEKEKEFLRNQIAVEQQKLQVI